jgi:hypothetical protein
MLRVPLRVRENTASLENLQNKTHRYISILHLLAEVVCPTEA